jgi:hypothetical protein
MDDEFEIEEPSPLAVLAALFAAETVDELWRGLVLGPGLSCSTGAWDAEMLWRHHHEEGQPGALDSALLLCTEHGCRQATNRVIAAIVASGVLQDDELALLARRLMEGTTILWQVPASWREGDGVESLLQPADGADEADGAAAGDEAGLFARRQVRPPLHRWAAGQLLRHDPTSSSALLGARTVARPG